MVDFMSDGILDASEIPLPEGLGIDKDGASSDIYRLIRNLEQVIKSRFPGCEIYLSKYTEIIRDVVALDDFESHILCDVSNWHRDRRFKRLCAVPL